MSMQEPLHPDQRYGTYPKKKSKVPLVVGILVAVVLGMCGIGVGMLALVDKAGESIQEQVEVGSTELLSHVTVTRCAKGSFGTVDVDFTVTNKSAKTESYFIQFNITDADGTRLAEAHGIVNNLAPGAVAKEQATGGPIEAKDFKCALVRVD